MLGSRVRAPEGVRKGKDENLSLFCAPPGSENPGCASLPGRLGGCKQKSTRLPTASSAVEPLRGYRKKTIERLSSFFCAHSGENLPPILLSVIIVHLVLLTLVVTLVVHKDRAPIAILVATCRIRGVSTMPFGPSGQKVLLSTSNAVVVQWAPLVTRILIVAVRTSPFSTIAIACCFSYKPANSSQYKNKKK